MKRFAYSLCLYLALSPLLMAQQGRVVAGFNTELAYMGNTVAYVVRLQNVDTDRLQIDIPEVDGLIFGEPNTSTSSRTSFANGRMTSVRQISIQYPVQAQRTGSFVVPAHQITAGGEVYIVQAARIEVREVPAHATERYSLNIVAPRPYHYVGETQIMQVGLVSVDPVRRSASLRFEHQADYFDIQRITRQVPGRPQGNYSVEFGILATALRAGNEQFIWATRIDDARYGGIVIANDPQFREVRALPEEGAPAEFSGAIGNFEAEAQLSRDSLRAGQSTTVLVAVQGQGNFGRGFAPIVEEAEGLRMIEGDPEVTALDNFSYTGVARFTLNFIPEDESVTEIPPVEFNWFDPERAVYESVTFGPWPIDVMPADTTQFVGNIVAGQPTATPAALRPILLDVGSRRGVLAATWTQTNFWVAQGGLGMAYLLLLTVLWRRRKLRENDYLARRVRGSKAVRRYREEARKAAQEGDAPAFFNAACRSIQEAIASDMTRRVKAEALLLPEIDAHLLTRETEASLREDAAKIFEQGDALHFAPSAVLAEDLKAWDNRLSRLLKGLAG